jgi:hypothetical protein
MNLETGWDGRPWTERICLRTGTSGELLTLQQETFGMHKLIRRISSTSNELLAFKDGPCPMALLRSKPDLSMNHEYCSLPLDLQNSFFLRRSVMPTSVILQTVLVSSVLFNSPDFIVYLMSSRTGRSEYNLRNLSLCRSHSLVTSSLFRVQHIILRYSIRVETKF